MFTKSTYLFLTAIFVMLSSVANAAEPYLQWDSRITHNELDNGLQYYLYDSQSESDPFNIRLIVHAGSIDEPEVKGIAHAVEHMVFNKTQDHPDSIHSYLAQIGWRTGKEINAKTRQTETQYMLRTRPNDALDIKGSLALLADMMGSAQLTEQDWFREKRIISEEKRLTESVVERLSQQIKMSTLANSKYDKGSVIGSFESIENTTIDDIQQFYKRNYVASNMTLIISGRFDIEATEELIKESFGTLPKVQKPERPYLNYPLDEQIKINAVQDQQGSSSKSALGFRVAIADKTTLEGQQTSLENYFIRKLLTKQVLRNSVYLSDEVKTLSAVTKTPANQRLTLAFGASTENHDQGLKAILAEVERLKKYGLDEADFNDSFEKAKAISVRNVDAAKGRSFAEWEDKITNAVIGESVLASPQDVHDLQTKLFENITLERLNQRLRSILNSSDIFIYYQAPLAVKLQLPTVDTVKLWQQQAKTADIQNPVAYSEVKPNNPKTKMVYAEVATIELAKPKDNKLPQPDAVYPDQSVYEWILKNGNRLVWLNRPSSDGKIYLKSISDIGALSNQFPDWLAQSSIQIFEQTPPTKHEQQEWLSWISSHGAEWKFKLLDQHLDMSLVTEKDQLENALLVFWQHHQDRQFTQESVTAVKESAQALLDSDLPDSLAKARYGTEQLTIPTQNHLNALTSLELSHAANRLVQQPHSLFVVGELDIDTLRKLGGKYLSSIGNAEALTSKQKVQVFGKQSVTRNRVGMRQTQVTMYGESALEWTPETAFMLSTLNPIAQQALRNRLRLELGGVYRVGFEMTLDSVSDLVGYELTFTTQPELADRLSNEAEDVLSTLDQAIKETDLERLRQDIAYAEANRLQSSTTWLNRLMLSYRAYGDPRYLTSMKSISDQITKVALVDLADKVLPASKRIQIKTVIKPETSLSASN
ncbi:M16 family metallopeptidase [Vibrio ziniensis]|uniref:Insulinase family protein n=1 Tax=Vibrio ziniensis TaxID=2711221 RepID=A0A6G7CP55_9VIBR|nr:insulinase family protein [Vibrio ziniensis]QIH43869.1 insulinase family protein [Vibrio ziniensis]